MPAPAAGSAPACCLFFPVPWYPLPSLLPLYPPLLLHPLPLPLQLPANLHPPPRSPSRSRLLPATLSTLPAWQVSHMQAAPRGRGGAMLQCQGGGARGRAPAAACCRHNGRTWFWQERGEGRRAQASGHCTGSATSTCPPARWGGPGESSILQLPAATLTLSPRCARRRRHPPRHRPAPAPRSRARPALTRGPGCARACGPGRSRGCCAPAPARGTCRRS